VRVKRASDNDLGLNRCHCVELVLEHISSAAINHTVNDAGKTGNAQLSTSSLSDYTSTAANYSEDMDETIIINNGE